MDAIKSNLNSWTSQVHELIKLVDHQVPLLFVCGAGLSSFFPLCRKTTSTLLKFALLSSTWRAYSSAPAIESNRTESKISFKFFRVYSKFIIWDEKIPPFISAKEREKRICSWNWRQRGDKWGRCELVSYFGLSQESRGTSDICYPSCNALMKSRGYIPQPGWTVVSALKYETAIYKRSILLWKINFASEHFSPRDSDFLFKSNSE